jgi:hypothetical protein
VARAAVPEFKGTCLCPNRGVVSQGDRPRSPAQTDHTPLVFLPAMGRWAGRERGSLPQSW